MIWYICINKVCERYRVSNLQPPLVDGCSHLPSNAGDCFLVMEEEIWKCIKGLEGTYGVSSFGMVRSLPRLAWNGYLWHQIPGCVLKQRMSSGGYPMVTLWQKGIKKDCLVHILVCEAFHGHRPKDEYEVDHIDGNKRNNRADNLRWVSHLDNMNNPVTKMMRKSSIAGKKPISQFSKTGELIATFNSITEAAQSTGINIGNIGSCVAGNKKHKTAGGYIWKYANENKNG